MSLEMSKFFAGVHGPAANPYAVGHFKLPILYQQDDQKRKRQILTAANGKSQKSLMVIANCNETARAAIGLPRKRTPSTLPGLIYSSAKAVQSAQNRWTKGKSHFSRYKNSDGSGGSAIKKIRKEVKKHQHSPQWQLLRKSISKSGVRQPSPGTCGYICGPLDDPPGLKWIMRPARNFKSSSDSASEGNGEFVPLKCMGKLEITSQNLTVKTSWPDDISAHRRARAHDQRRTDVNSKMSKHSRVFCVPSQRILLVDQLKQAQLRQAKARRVRSQHKEQQHLNQSTQKQVCRRLPDKVLLIDEVAGMTSVPKSETPQTLLGDDTLTLTTDNDLAQKASSSSSYQTTNDCSSTSCRQSESIGNMWSSDQKYDTPIVQHNGNSKFIKLTSTVIKIMPETVVEKKTEPAPSVRPQVHSAVRQLLQLPKRVSIQTTHESPTQVMTPQHQHHLQSPTFAPVPKIIRVKQHKIPRTMEDGIDMSYQYFVSTPLKRGKRPQTIRYLYRPMVRSLNSSPTTLKHTRKSKKNNLGKVDAENSKKTPVLNTFTEASMGEQGADLNFGAPPLNINAKYRPLLEKLAKMPFPAEIPKDHKARSGSNDTHLDRLALLPPLWKPDSKSMLQSQASERNPLLLDYQPNATILDSKTGAYISYHAPLHFQRMTGGGATENSNDACAAGSSIILGNSLSPPIIAAVTYEDIELQMRHHSVNTTKTVSFQLTDLCVSKVSSSSFATHKKTYTKKKINSHCKTKGKFKKNVKIAGRK